MDSQLLRLRYKDKIVGYLWIADMVLILAEKELIIGRFQDYRDNKAELVQWNSFDLSIKQGDEWFFEGDEVEASGVTILAKRRGILEFSGSRWGIVVGIEDEEHFIPFDEEYELLSSTLTLIRRAT